MKTNLSRKLSEKSCRLALLISAAALLCVPAIATAQSRLISGSELLASSPHSAFPHWDAYGPSKAIDSSFSSYWHSAYKPSRYSVQYFSVKDRLNRERDLASVHILFADRNTAPDKIYVYAQLNGRYTFIKSIVKNRFHVADTFANIHFGKSVRADGILLALRGPRGYNIIKNIALRDYNPWRNHPNPCDVSGNGTVDPNDLRLITKELNIRYNNGQSSRLPAFNTNNKPKWDVNNDGRISSRDLNVSYCNWNSN